MLLIIRDIRWRKKINKLFLYKLAMNLATSNFYADVYAVSYFSERNRTNKIETRSIHWISSRSFSFANFVYHKAYVER